MQKQIAKLEDILNESIRITSFIDSYSTDNLSSKEYLLFIKLTELVIDMFIDDFSFTKEILLQIENKYKKTYLTSEVK